MYCLQQSTFYVLDERQAKEFDAMLPEREKLFSTLLPGSNAYLLDTDGFDSFQYLDFDPGDSEYGCSIALDSALSKELRLRLCSGLIGLGYAVSLYQDHLHLVPWHRDTVTEVVDRDVKQLLSSATSVRVLEHSPELDLSSLSESRDRNTRKGKEPFYHVTLPDTSERDIATEENFWQAVDTAVVWYRSLSAEKQKQALKVFDEENELILKICAAVASNLTPVTLPDYAALIQIVPDLWYTSSPSAILEDDDDPSLCHVFDVALRLLIKNHLIKDKEL